MFPDMDAEVIEAVLRANNGAVDTTIDHLLTMTADNEAEKHPETHRWDFYLELKLKGLFYNRIHIKIT